MEVVQQLMSWLPSDPGFYSLFPALFALLLSISIDFLKRRRRGKLRDQAHKAIYGISRSSSRRSEEGYVSRVKNDFNKALKHLRSYKALGYYAEVGRRFVLFYAVTFNFVFLVAFFVFLGGYVGYKASFILDGVKVRDISYGIGILVAAGVSFIATESGRHNKKHEITEKSLSSLRDVAGEFCQKIGEVRHLARRARDLSESGWEELDLTFDSQVRSEAIKRRDEFNEVSSEMEKSVQEAITKWNIFEICYGSLYAGNNGLPGVFQRVKSNIDDLSGVAHAGKDSREVKYEELARSLDVSGLMRYVSSFISKKHAKMKKDYWFLFKVWAICLIACSLLGVYLGYIAGEGGFNLTDFLVDYVRGGG